MTIVVAMIIAAIVGPVVFRVDPLSIDLANVLAGPSRTHPFGCDGLGRDVLARVLWGARLSLSISTVVVALSLVVGSMVGAIAALSGGRIDNLIMRGVDIILAFPGILLAIALAAILGSGLIDLEIALTAMGWTGYARIVRGEVLSLREREYVLAAESLGAGRSRLLIRHLIPGVVGPLAVQATFGIGGIIGAEAALSFLGLGAQPPTPSWGNMLDAGRAFLLVAPHLTTAPGIAIGVSILGFNLLGDGIAQRIGQRT
ncbi:MAG TPA: ABC transporter permease [Candidatus Binatus sp.]|nr:ABC transporter permease [Candidatus Binatus sp.]